MASIYDDFEISLTRLGVVYATPNVLEPLLEGETPPEMIASGDLIGNLTIKGTAHIKGGQTAYAAGTGFFLGYSDDAYKFSIGSDTDYIRWNGTNLEMLCSSENAIHIKYGSDILLEHGGDIKFTSVTAPTALTCALAGAGAGNVDDGAHYYKVIFINEAGETELGTTSTVLTVTDKTANGQVSLTAIPVSTSSSVTKRRIYRTKAGATQNYYLLVEIADNTTTTYTDNTADGGLVSGYLDKDSTTNNTFGKIFIDGLVSVELASLNSFIGQSSGQQSTTGYSNVGVGAKSLYSNTAGFSNVAVGQKSLYSNTGGDNNVAIGDEALYSGLTANSSIAIGKKTLYTSTSGGNIAIGGYALYYATSPSVSGSGSVNIAIGGQALYSNTTGYANIAIGAHALSTSTTTGYNVAIGNNAGHYLSGQRNIALGNFALEAYAGGGNTADYNTAIGDRSMAAITTGDYNTAVGSGALGDNTTGNENTAVGRNALDKNSTGSGNVGLGHFAGYYETGSNKLFIDNASRTNEATARASALIYGVFNSTVANQTLLFNATATFKYFPVTPSSAPTTDYQVANKKYVDDNAGGSGVFGRSVTQTDGSQTTAGTYNLDIAVGVSGFSYFEVWGSLWSYEPDYSPAYKASKFVIKGIVDGNKIMGQTSAAVGAAILNADFTLPVSFTSTGYPSIAAHNNMAVAITNVTVTTTNLRITYEVTGTNSGNETAGVRHNFSTVW